MPQSLAQLYTHLIFSTKNRQPVLHDEVRERLGSYLGGILREQKSPSIAVGVVKDHVHLLYRHSNNLPLADLIEGVKTGSSKWLKTQSPTLAGFHWQNGYGAFSASASRLEAVRRYVLNQEEHHREVTFEEEFRRFLREYGIDYDKRFVWD